MFVTEEETEMVWLITAVYRRRIQYKVLKFGKTCQSTSSDVDIKTPSDVDIVSCSFIMLFPRLVI